jgi:predicted NBD/HSP70 family sugar kinase
LSTLPITPVLDSDFLPAESVFRQLEEAAYQTPHQSQPLIYTLEGVDQVWRFEMTLPFRVEAYADASLLAAERLCKTMLWIYGGYRLWGDGPDAVAQTLRTAYAPTGARAFDAQFMGVQVYGHAFCIEVARVADHPEPKQAGQALGGHWQGCRIGFDLGGSDRKLAAVIDGKVVHAEEVVWNPYFESDPTYHVAGIRDCIERAAKHLPRVDAIGGSAAGIYVDNQPRVGSLFRGIERSAFTKQIQPLFKQLQAEYGVPIAVINDGDVTALTGTMALERNALLGIAMGTSQAGGFVDAQGSITGALNELAFAPIDWRFPGPTDEWSGDMGVGALYFSQQAVGRLAKSANLDIDPTLPLPQQLVAVQKLADAGDAAALAIFQTIGTYLAWSLPFYDRFYQQSCVLLLGRVTSGAGGVEMLAQARRDLAEIAPDLMQRMQIEVPNEKQRRLGQAVAAASLPELN